MAQGGPTSKVLGHVSSQELPPSGGYPAIKTRRYLPSRGPSGFSLWFGSLFIISTGFYLTGQENLRRNDDKMERREARKAIYPFLQAEEDRRYVREEGGRGGRGRSGWTEPYNGL